MVQPLPRLTSKAWRIPEWTLLSGLQTVLATRPLPVAKASKSGGQNTADLCTVDRCKTFACETRWSVYHEAILPRSVHVWGLFPTMSALCRLLGALYPFGSMRAWGVTPRGRGEEAGRLGLDS